MNTRKGFILSQTLAQDAEDPLAKMYVAMHPEVDPNTHVRYVRIANDDGFGVTVEPRDALVFPNRKAAQEVATRIIADELEQTGAHSTWSITEQAALAQAA